MAKDKKGFMLYADQKELFNKLPDELAGKLIKHVFSYVNDENPKCNDLIIDIAFEPIKQQLKRDLKKWESRAEQSRINGSKGGRPKTQTEPKKPNGLNNNPSKPEKPVKDNVKDNVNVKETVKEKDIIKDDLSDFIDLMNNDIWIESIAMQLHIDPDKINDLRNEFINDRKLDQDYKDLQNIKTWFVNYCKRNKGTPIKNESEEARKKRIIEKVTLLQNKK